MNDIVRLETNARRSRAVICNGIIFLSGQFADDEELDVRGQMQQALAKIDQLLQEAGTDRGRVLTAQIWLKNIQKDFAAMNEVWDMWTVPGASPTRVTGQVEMATPGMLVEIVVTAALRQ